MFTGESNEYLYSTSMFICISDLVCMVSELVVIMSY
jgi:hypothetical protein